MQDWLIELCYYKLKVPRPWLNILEDNREVVVTISELSVVKKADMMIKKLELIISHELDY
jgi:hypothetical protein